MEQRREERRQKDLELAEKEKEAERMKFERERRAQEVKEQRERLKEQEKMEEEQMLKNEKLEEMRREEEEKRLEEERIKKAQASVYLHDFKSQRAVGLPCSRGFPRTNLIIQSLACRLYSKICQTMPSRGLQLHHVEDAFSQGRGGNVASLFIPLHAYNHAIALYCLSFMVLFYKFITSHLRFLILYDLFTVLLYKQSKENR